MTTAQMLQGCTNGNTRYTARSTPMEKKSVMRTNGKEVHRNTMEVICNLPNQQTLRLCRGLVAIVGFDNIFDQLVAHHIALVQLNKANVFHVFQNAYRFAQTRFLVRR